MIYRGRVQNGVIVFEGQTPLPEGTEVQIFPFGPPNRNTLAEQFAQVIGKVTDPPANMAQQHDRYPPRDAEIVTRRIAGLRYVAAFSTTCCT